MNQSADSVLACHANAKVPIHDYGTHLSEGHLFRNLKPRHVAKKYESDGNEDPKYGRKLSGRFWKDVSNEPGDLSVNEVVCSVSEKCSIQLQEGSSDYSHVATINLALLNEFSEQHKFVAVYKPVKKKEGSEHPGNPCHYEILPTTGTATANIILRKEFKDKPFPGGRLPVGNDDVAKATEFVAQYDQMISIKLNVHSD